MRFKLGLGAAGHAFRRLIVNSDGGIAIPSINLHDRDELPTVQFSRHPVPLECRLQPLAGVRRIFATTLTSANFGPQFVTDCQRGRFPSGTGPTSGYLTLVACTSTSYRVFIAPVRSLNECQSDKKLQFFETALALNEHRRSPEYRGEGRHFAFTRRLYGSRTKLTSAQS